MALQSRGGPRRACLACFLVFAFVLSGASALADPRMRPMLPAFAAQGFASVATSEGYEALFSNPAGFRSEPGELTALSVNPWIEGAFSLTDMEGAILDRASSEGVRFGNSLGIGYSGRGLGLGLFLLGSADVAGSQQLSGTADFELGMVGGYSYALSLFGHDLALGASLRPLIRAEVPLDDAASRRLIRAASSGGLGVFQALWAEDALYAAGLAVDVGARLDLGSVRLGLAVTDVGGTSFQYSRTTLGGLVTSLVSLTGVPQGASTDESLKVPMRWHLGASAPITSWLLAQAEITDPLSALRGDEDLLDSLHAGLRVALGRRENAWLGWNSEGLTAGLGLAFGPVQTSVAVYGVDPRSPASLPGISAEAALRF